MGLFIILPFLGGWVGYSYAPEKIVEVEKIIVIEADTPSNTLNDFDTDADKTTPVELLELTSPIGNTITMSANSGSVTKYGDGRFDTSECDWQFIPENFLYDGHMSEYEDKNDCKVVINKSDTTVTYLERELVKIGGIPQNWVDDTNFTTYFEATDGVYSPVFGTAGIFDTTLGTFTETIQTEQPGINWKRKFITHGSDRYMIVVNYENEDRNQSYDLYTVKSSRDFYDFFLPDSHWGEDNEVTKSTLDPDTISELEFIGTFEETNNDPEEIVADLDGNLFFTFGVIEGKQDFYLLDTSAGTLEKKSGM